MKNREGMFQDRQQIKFDLGRLLSTPGAIVALEEAGVTAQTYLARHQSGDWGDLSDDDKAENNLSIREGFRILSAYVLPATEEKIWIITEADRAATTILLPSEY